MSVMILCYAEDKAAPSFMVFSMNKDASLMRTEGCTNFIYCNMGISLEGSWTCLFINSS